MGDGLYGYAENAEYDRLIATCSVRTIPPAWLQQVRAGGTITTPMSGWMGETAFAHLGSPSSGRPARRSTSAGFLGRRRHVPGRCRHRLASRYTAGPRRRVDSAPARADSPVGCGGESHRDMAGSRTAAPIRLRLTVTPERQSVWLGEPDGPFWELPA
ncbi:hypothetical protein [Nonomuraea basaltis]|uniref:hypothetical protein n=1 Tax=Nonomuraea basaltis TaxID=2495887 RepID=UPI003B8467B2